MRDQLGFGGVVISDDVEMGAIRSRYGLDETVIRAVMAGTDILLFSNTAYQDPDLGAQVHATLVGRAKEDAAFAARIKQSYARIVALKRDMGLLP